MGKGSKPRTCSTREDESLEVCHSAPKATNASTLGRAYIGARSPTLTLVTREEWLLRRTFTGGTPDLATLMAAKAGTGASIAVVLPAKDVAPTVGPICAAISERWRSTTAPLVDELVVIDGASRDGTVREARAAGATVVDERSVLPRVAGAGKGGAMWRSLAATTADLVVWIDADIDGFDADYVPSLVAPLLGHEEIGYVKGYFHRPLGDDPDGGGRVTEICARPLINRFRPKLAGLVQPLAGEAAGRRSLLEHLPFFSGYAVEIGLLWDVLDRAGLEAIAQVNLGTRRHRNQPTAALGRMAYEITEAVLRREGLGRPDLAPYARPIPRAGGFVFDRTPTDVVELPPMASIPLGERR